jgi:hypothetical protein
MMGSLHALSEELLFRIINYFDDYHTLCAVCLISKTFNRIATQKLYSEVHLIQANIDTGVKHLIPFAFLIFQKPHVASWVRSFSIRGHYGPKRDLIRLEDIGTHRFYKDHPEWRRRGWPDSKEVDSVIESAVSKLGYEGAEKQRWIKSLRGGNDESEILAILLSNLPNLRRLDLADGGHNDLFDDDALLALFARIGKRDPILEKYAHFSNLEEVMMAGTETKYPIGSDSFGTCAGLPAIKSLYGFKIGEEEQEEASATYKGLGKGTSTLEMIELRESKYVILRLKIPLRRD